MGVCDGHGLQGHLVSNFVKVNLPQILSAMIQKQPIDKLGGSNSPSKKTIHLPSIGSNNHKKSPYDIEGPGSSSNNLVTENDEPAAQNNEYWLSNQNFKVRDYQIKDAFIKTE